MCGGHASRCAELSPTGTLKVALSPGATSPRATPLRTPAGRTPLLRRTRRRGVDTRASRPHFVAIDDASLGDKMTNVYGRPEKVELRRKLFGIGVHALEKDGWKIERVQGSGKSSMRRITRGVESKLVAIRTTQDTSIAFPRDKTDRKWVTLSDVDAVVAVSVDDAEEPRFAQVHVLDGKEMRDRFDRTYRARMAAGYMIPLGRGVWVSLYQQEAQDPPSRVGAGAGLDHPPIYRVSLLDGPGPEGGEEAAAPTPSDGPLTIGEAKRRLALTFGVAPQSVKITIEA